MDCATFSNLFARFACIMNGTRVDEYFGFGVLVFIGIAGIVIMVNAFIAGWKAKPTK